MDTSLFRRINHFADQTTWLHPVAVAYAKYGIVLFACLILWTFWQGRRQGDIEAMARSAWVGAGTLLALGIGQILGGIIDRKRPYETLHGVHVLVSRTTDFSIPSDHATAVGAVAVGLLLVNRRIGLIATVLAAVMAFDRVYAAPTTQPMSSRAWPSAVSSRSWVQSRQPACWRRSSGGSRGFPG